jgi:4-hydroxybenzoate polyprenyltransferase
MVRATVLGLVRACHAAPCVAVTAFGTALGAAVGNTAGTCALLAAALLSGQLSIGWSNDRIDAPRDRIAGRSDKPLAVEPRLVPVVDRCLVAAIAATVAFSLALGWRAGLLHLAAVGCGWLYNAGVKSTAVSWLPYAAAFAALPAIATLALPAHPAPAWWALTAGALLGVAAHLANAVPDLDDDARTGVRGFPQRLGAHRSLLIAAAALAAGTLVLVLGPAQPPSPLRWAGLAVALALTGGGTAFATRHPDARWAFPGVIAVAALDVLLLLLGPSFAH